MPTLPLTDAAARHLLALRQRGLTYAAIVAQEHLDIAPRRVQAHLERWMGQQGLAVSRTYAPLFRRIPAQGHSEASGAYHQRVSALGLALCHWCHHQLRPGRLWCRQHNGSESCEGVVRRLMQQGYVDDGLCGCPEVVAWLRDIQSSAI